MQIIPLQAFTDNYIWVIEAQKTAVLIDPGDAAPVFAYLKAQAVEPIAVFLTHHHFDHSGGVADLVEAYPNLAVYGPQDPRMPMVNQIVGEGDKISVLSRTFEVWAIPGHSASHLCFYERAQEWLFCGDTLFSAGCGRIFDGSIEGLYQSLMRLRRLPDSTLVYPAHEYTQNNLAFAKQVEPMNQAVQALLSELKKSKTSCSLPTTIGREKAINPFFRLEEETIRAYAASQGVCTTDPEAVFALLRQEKDGF